MSYNEGPLVSLEVVQYAESDSAQCYYVSHFEFCSKLLYFTNTEVYRYEIVKCLPKHRLVAKSYNKTYKYTYSFCEFCPMAMNLTSPYSLGCTEFNSTLFSKVSHFDLNLFFKLVLDCPIFMQLNSDHLISNWFCITLRQIW